MRLQKALLTLQSYNDRYDPQSVVSRVDARVMLLVTVVYLVIMLSVSLEKTSVLIWFAAYPILLSPLCGVSYSTVLRRSLIVLPFIIFIGIFNPIYDQRVAFDISGVKVTAGWLTFISLLIRGLLSVQALLILLYAVGFKGICSGLQKMGLPKVLTVQLMFLYRFMGVLLEEAYTTHRGMISRGFGRRSYPLKIWIRVVGALLLRTLSRSRRVYQAMQSRGYDGTLYV